MGKGGIENRVEQRKTDVSAFNADFRLGGLYDSRVGSASGGGDEDSDRALAATLNAGWQAPMAGDVGFRVDYSGYADFHQDFDEYDVIDQSLSLEPQYNDGPFVHSLPVAFNYAMEDGKRDYQRYSAAPTVTYLFPGTSHAMALYGIGALIDDRDDVNLDEDGESLGGGAAYLYFFQNNSRARVSVDYQHTTYDARVVDYNTASVSGNEREDDALVAGLDVLFQINAMLSLYANYSFIHSNSNVSLYEYDRHLVEAGVSLKF